MKKNIGKTTFATLLLAGCLVLTGCGSASYSDTKSDSYTEKAQAYGGAGFDSYNGVESSDVDEAVEYEMAEAAADDSVSEVNSTTDNINQDPSKQAAQTGKKIIKTYRFSYDTEKFDEAYQYLRQQVEAYGGYISSSELYGTELRRLSLTARVPVDQCDNFVNQLGGLGTIVSQSESAEDVTLQYNDTESRIASLKTEQQRLNELLKDADSLETIIALEDRLTDVRYELENYQSQKNLYDDLITYCTVNISLSEVSYEVPVDDSTIFSRMKTGLITSFRDISYDFVNFIVWLVVASPYLIIWAVVIFVIYRIIRKIAKKRKAKKEAKRAAKEANKIEKENESAKKDKSDKKEQPVTENQEDQSQK
ncbi:MAG: DUF4349 domain-containing protein [Lachnospiraceae bacterium]